MNIFLIGPGGVGKSTAGGFLAKLLEYNFIDLDLQFMKQIGDIDEYIEDFGYDNYARKNSDLFYSLLNELDNKSVFVLSSGFLVHDNLNDLTMRHWNTLQENGTSILLLPSKDIHESMEIVVKRQMNRGFNLKEEFERKKFEKRFQKYLIYGDIQVYSCDSPERIAFKMKIMLEEYTEYTDRIELC